MTGRLPVLVVASAARAIAEASEWWLANRDKAPGGFAEELERAFQLIASQPNIGARALNARLANVRRIHLARIRYHLYYRGRFRATRKSGVSLLAHEPRI